MLERLAVRLLTLFFWAGPSDPWIQSADVREGSVLFKCISVVVQRFSSVLLHDTLIANLPDL